MENSFKRVNSVKNLGVKQFVKQYEMGKRIQSKQNKYLRYGPSPGHVFILAKVKKKNKVHSLKAVYLSQPNL